MKVSVSSAVFLVLSLTGCGQEAANTPAVVSNVEIISPADGAKLSIKADNKVDYNITLGSDGDHAHIYVDDRRIGMLRQMQGSHSIDYLDPGKREICIKIVNSNHTPIGVGRCVTIMAE